MTPSPLLLFASCNQPYITPTPEILSLWSSMRSLNPAGFTWGGDAVYGDAVHGWNFTLSGPVPNRKPADYAKLIRSYDRVLREPFYPVSPAAYHFGTLDDHDLGVNNGGKWFGMAESNEAAEAFLGHFLERSNEGYYAGAGAPYERGGDPVWARGALGSDPAFPGGKGVYGVKVFEFGGGAPRIYHEATRGGEYKFPGLGEGDPGSKIAVFVVDCRTNKDAWPPGIDMSNTAGTGLDFLGEGQWAWLEEALGKSDARVNVLVNGLQVNSANRIPSGNVAEVRARAKRGEGKGREGGGVR
ncbi:hypothetical protein TeGR_g9292 [Tetraparma gracilis]|uniref:PhoD-like phosphatase metallophosphatase domain-containing protein n=1 Tax=Tetraparma gracilis TaxID=2962635 RepID=A0ABQ6M3T6_9STRA|nr:hypothetical protein TeGR_g9292 [Tetraparma gracilis]